MARGSSNRASTVPTCRSGPREGTSGRWPDRTYAHCRRASRRGRSRKLSRTRWSGCRGAGPSRRPDGACLPSGKPTCWLPGTPGRDLDPAQYRCDLAEYCRVVTVDRLIRVVVRQQPHVPVLALERLDRSLTVEHRRHDLAVLGAGLLTYDHVVAVADRRIDHRVTGDLEQEEGAVADEALRERHDLLDALLGQDRATGGDPADHRNVRGGGHRIAYAGLINALDLVGSEHRERSWAVGVALEEALLLQDAELVGNRGRTGEAHTLADLAHARGISAPLNGVADHCEHPLLPRRQATGVRRPVGQLCDAGARAYLALAGRLPGHGLLPQLCRPMPRRSEPDGLVVAGRDRFTVVRPGMAVQTFVRTACRSLSH